MERTSLRSDIIKEVDGKNSSPSKEKIMEYHHQRVDGIIKGLMEKKNSRQGWSERNVLCMCMVHVDKNLSFS